MRGLLIPRNVNFVPMTNGGQVRRVWEQWYADTLGAMTKWGAGDRLSDPLCGAAGREMPTVWPGGPHPF